MGRLPLERVRVVDFSHVWAGPYLTRILADWGAQVIKVESLTRFDSDRGSATADGKPPTGTKTLPQGKASGKYLSQGARYTEYNRNKHAIGVDLTTPEGLELVKSLIVVSDVVVENFSVGVMARFGLDYPDLRRLRPDIVMLSMPAFGSTGPESRYVGMGGTQEAISGLSSLIGYPGGGPMETGVIYGDCTNAVFGAAAVVSALRYRQRTGKGLFIDWSQREAVTHLVPEPLLEYQMTGRVMRSAANRHPAMAPHGCYPCAGEDSWLVIAVESDEMWQALCRAMGRDDLAHDPALATLPGRKRREDEMDKAIAGWTRGRDHYEAMHTLQSHGVAAEAVLKATELLHDPHYKERGYFETCEVPDAGSYPTHGMSFKLSRTQGRVRFRAPGIGEHNQLVLGELLGIDKARLAELNMRKVIGASPI